MKSIECTCDAMPVQYEGELDNGERFYFRARWSHWGFGVGQTKDAAVANCVMWEPWGNDFASASHMPLDEAERIIAECERKYLEDQSCAT